MLEFIIIMVILDILMKIKVEKPIAEDEPEKEKPMPKAYVCNNTAEWEFKSLDDAMAFREWRLAGNKGNAIDYYRYMEEE